MKRSTNWPWTLAATAVALTLCVPPAHADSTAVATGNLAFTSDYVFRGITQSNGSPALQGGIDADLPALTHVGAWASSLSPDDPLEVDLYGGFTRSLSTDVSLRARGAGYLYPHDLSTSTFEAEARLTWRAVRFAQYYDFVLESAYSEFAIDHKVNERITVGGRGGFVAQSGSPALWDWELSGRLEFGPSNVKAMLVGHEETGVRGVVSVQVDFPIPTR